MNSSIEIVTGASLGAMHSCAIRTDGELFCWGNNQFGQVGDAYPYNSIVMPYEPLSVDLGGASVAKVAAGGKNSWSIMGPAHTCAILTSGSLFCWGSNDQGQLGNGFSQRDNGQSANLTPNQVIFPGNLSVLDVSAGNRHTCAILDNGSAYCWGDNLHGQLGNGLSGNSDDNTGSLFNSTPVMVSLPANRTALSIASGETHTCAILDNGSAYCWGEGWHGQLGNGALTETVSPVPVNLPVGAAAVSITAGGYHTCAIIDDGSAYCWGLDAYGQLGNDENTSDESSPVLVALPSNHSVTSLSAGIDHSCAVVDDGVAYCWGNNLYGNLGNGLEGWNHNEPLPSEVILPYGRSAIEIFAGGTHSCFTLDDGSLWCWGDNNRGQIGDGSTSDSNTSRTVNGFRGSLPTYQILALLGPGRTRLARLPALRPSLDNIQEELGIRTQTIAIRAHGKTSLVREPATAQTKATSHTVQSSATALHIRLPVL